MYRLLPILAFLFVASCADKPAAIPSEPMEETIHPEEEPKESPASESLKSMLEERKASFLEKAPQDKIDLFNRGIQAIADDKVIEGAKNVGDQAPQFSLPNALGETVNLEDLLAEGPIVLTWYRGGWCPYCNLTLAAFQDKSEKFKALGVQLVAISPEIPDSSLSTKEKSNLEFEVLSDQENKVAALFGLKYQLMDELAVVYENNAHISTYNLTDESALPLAATYVIETDGTISYAFLDNDYRNRAEPQEILDFMANK